MRQITAQEKYRAVKEGILAEGEFVRQMRLAFPQFISPQNTYPDTVQILKNYDLINEGKEAKEAEEVSKYSDDSLRRAIDIELEVMGLMSQETISGEDHAKAKTKAVKNLKKDPLHYYNLIAGESSKVDKNDKMKETKPGAKDKDTFNDMKKAELKEEVSEADPIPTEPGITGKRASNHDRKMAMRKVIDFLTIAGEPKTGHKVTSADALNFIKTHNQDIFSGDIDAYDINDVWDNYNEYEAVNRDDVGELAVDRKGNPKIDSEPSRFKGRDKSRIRGTKENVDEKMSDEFMAQVANYGKQKNQKTYELGDHWSDDFDYAGMLKAALKIRLNTPMKVMQQIYDSFEDVNYHRENRHLHAAMDALKNNNKEEAAQHLKDHKKEIALTVKQMSEAGDGNFVREGYYGQSNMDQIAGALGYSDLDEFLNDNPGATEGMVQWISGIPEFRKKLSSEYSTSELNNLGFYDIEGYDSEEEDLDEKKVNENIEAFSDTIQVVGYPKTVEDALKVIERYERDRDPVSREEAKEIVADMRATDDDDFDRNITNLIVKAFNIKLKGVSEKKGKDHDGDGDVDGDDYMHAKDKAIKKAMGKDEQLVKENIKSIITKIFEDKPINEAATAQLADWGKGYEAFPGVKPVVIELENIVTEIEQFYDKIGEKIAKTFSKTADFRNEEGLKIGAFISPSLEAAFKKDLRPVIKGGFTKKIELPKVRTISQADIDRGSVAETEVEEEKETVFTSPATVNGTLREALNKELGKFGPDLKKRFEALGYTVGLFANTKDIPDAAHQRMLKDPKLVGITYHKDGDTGYETIRVYSNSKNIKSLQKVADYFNLTDAMFGPEKDAGFAVKQAINKNDGDILRSDIGIIGNLANFNLFRFMQGNYKDVKTTDKQTGKTDLFKQAAE